MTTTEVQPFIFPTTGQQLRSMIANEEPAIEGLESYLYVVEFRGSGIKFGITTDPANRLGAHQHDGRVFGRPATRGWLAPPHVEAAANEDALKTFCAQQAGTERRGEYFAVPFDATCEFASRLPRSRGDRDAHQAKVNANWRGLMELIGWPPSVTSRIWPGIDDGALDAKALHAKDVDR